MPYRVRYIFRYNPNAFIKNGTVTYSVGGSGIDLECDQGVLGCTKDCLCVLPSSRCRSPSNVPSPLSPFALAVCYL